MNKKIFGIIIIVLFIGAGIVSNVYADNIYTNKNVSSTNLESDLIAYWNFDEGSGDIVHDSSGNGNEGYIYNCNWVSGHSGIALEFPNLDSMVYGVPDSLDDKITDYLSIQAWVKWYGSDPNFPTYIFDCRCYYGGFFFYITNQNKLGFCLYLDSEITHSISIKSISNISLNTWTHVKAVFDDNLNSMSLYINNQLDATIETMHSYYDSYNFGAIGNNLWAPGDGQWAPFNGVIDELKICRFENNPPNEPSVIYNKKDDQIIITSTDPDGDYIRYGISWENDEEIDQYTGYVSSGTEQSINCNGRKGTVGVIAEDEHGARSDWVLVKSKNKSIEYHTISLFFERLHQLLPFFEKILNQITF